MIALVVVVVLVVLLVAMAAKRSPGAGEPADLGCSPPRPRGADYQNPVAAPTGHRPMAATQVSAVADAHIVRSVRAGWATLASSALRALTATAIVVLDVNEVALQLALDGGADQTVLVDGSHVDKVHDITDGRGAEVVLDFVGERGAQRDAWQMTRRAGSHFVIGYGGRSKLRRST